MIDDEMVERACQFHHVGWSLRSDATKATAREVMRGALSAALAARGQGPVAKVIRQQTMVELLDAIYRHHGWKRQEGESRAKRVQSLYKITADVSNNRYIATPISQSDDTAAAQPVDVPDLRKPLQMCVDMLKSNGFGASSVVALAEDALSATSHLTHQPQNRQRTHIMMDASTQHAADMLNGREYGDETTPEILAYLKANGLVAVFGYSDDGTELRGAIDDETGIGVIHLDSRGIMRSECDADGDNCTYFKRLLRSAKRIKVNFGEEGYTFTYTTDVPHSTFEIVEDGNKYCKGIVFSMEDLKDE